MQTPGSLHQLSALPRVTQDTRAEIVRRIDAVGSQAFTQEAFTQEAIADLERNNPELLLMAHYFAEDRIDATDRHVAGPAAVATALALEGVS